MLITLSEAKNYLGIPAADVSYNSFLNQQIQVISDAIEGYCGRKFAQATYVQTFYWEDYLYYPKQLELFMYPLISVTSVEEDSQPITDFRIQKEYGQIQADTTFFLTGDELVITYEAGYATIPAIVKQVCYNVIEGLYNKKKQGINLSFGSDVQRISIPGTISIDFDYTLTQNERSNAFGSILGNNLNLLDKYRSERAINGSGKLAYVG